MNDPAATALRFYATADHDCSYLNQHVARTVFVDPAAPKSASLYSTLLEHGFRRSGEHVYRPHCPNCDACVPVRVPVREFVPARRHRRTWRSNADLEVALRPARYSDELFELYRTYLCRRHPGAGMDQPTRESFESFLLCDWSMPEFAEFRLAGRLAAVAVTDVVRDGLSAVYTFFDPALSARSPGTYAVLWQIEHARRLGLSYLYLGYWIAASPKMTYKSEFLPQQHFRNGSWTRVDRPSRVSPE